MSGIRLFIYWFLILVWQAVLLALLIGAAEKLPRGPRTMTVLRMIHVALAGFGDDSATR